MEYNRGTLQDYNYWQDQAMDAAGWTADEKINGKLESYNFNRNNANWDILNPNVKTTKIFAYTQNPDLSNDYVFEKQTDSLPVLTEEQCNDLLKQWFPDEQISNV